MINIKIDNPDFFKDDILVKKSIFISFKYDPDIVECIKGFSKRRYNASQKTWEMPIQNLIKFCNHFKHKEIHITGRYEKLKEDSTASIPKEYEFKTKPFQHQVEGVKFALTMNKFLLCDDQGLGKTKQMIDWVGCLSIKKKIKRALIICGVNSLKYNWLGEIKLHSNEKGWVLGTRFRKTTGRAYEGSTKDKIEDLDNLPDCKYIITNIETLRAGSKKVGKRKWIFPMADKIQKLCEDGEISVIIADEIHKMKNPSSLQGKAFLKLQAPYMAALTGTPLMNSPIDLYTPLAWLGFENHTHYAFQLHYGVFGGFANKQIVGYKNLDQLQELIDKIMLRRLKMEVLDLPEKIQRLEFVDMNAKQAQLYAEVQAGIRSEFNTIRFSTNPLSKLIRLRQVTGYPGIINEEITQSSKLDRMLELVQEITEADGKVIIFSNWSSITQRAKELLSQYQPAYITGEIKASTRMKEVERFQEDKKCKVIVGTLGAMGTGLTLTAAQDVIFLDSPWNRALKDQAEDRVHRIGTKGTVNITTLVCKDTIDERIETLVKKKGRMSDALIDGKLTERDLRFLLS